MNRKDFVRSVGKLKKRRAAAGAAKNIGEILAKFK